MDRYRDHLVVQVAALAIAVRVDLLVRLLVELTGPRGIVVRSDRKIAQAEGMELRDGLAWGEPLEPVTAIRENGILYRIDLSEGQKTGCYLDQRENRRAAAGYLRGRRVLDMCCYIGGFSLAAARHGPAREVLGVDSSDRAIQQAQANARENALENVRFRSGECFQTLQELVSALSGSAA